MKIKLILTAALLCGLPALGQTPPGFIPMEALQPAAPPGTNSATFPIPRIEWPARVKATNEKAHKIADTIPLVFDGDSITLFWQTEGKTIWAERYAKLNAFDFGIGGDRTENLLWRLAVGQVDGIHPKLIVLMIGTNNLGVNTAEEIADGVKAVVADYQKRCPDAVILLMGVLPRGELPSDPARPKVAAINQIIAKLGDGKKVIFLDIGDKLVNPDGTISKEMMPDFIHPTVKGYQIWADAIQPTIDRFFPAK